MDQAPNPKPPNTKQKTPLNFRVTVEQRGRNREEAKTNKQDRKPSKIDVKQKQGDSAAFLESEPASGSMT
jgi:hypothetical protein